MEAKFLLFFDVFILFIFTSSSLSPAPALATAAAASPFPKEALPTRAGYLPINPTSTSAIYYVFYEAQNPISPLSQTPLLIWLQGGPGCSSMIGNFYELGPWRINFNKKETEPLFLERNLGSWNRRFGLLFLDNPIGAGFSVASTRQEIPNNQASVAKQLFTAISSFIDSDSVFKNRPIYITGQSYAGKFVPSIGYYILKRNPQLPVSKRLALAGIGIGNGLTDPVNQVATHALNAYYSGLINEKQRRELEIAQSEAVRLTNMGNWREATNARKLVLDLLQNMTGLATLDDFTKKVPYKTRLVAQFLRSKEVRKALGVNESAVFRRCSALVRRTLREDVMKSVRFKVEFLLKNIKVLLYQGQLDLRDGVVSTEAWLKKMKWEETERFFQVDRKIWKVKGELAGYVQKWKNLSHVVVLGGGHLLPADQPLNSQAMIEDWVLEKGLFSNENIEEQLFTNFQVSI